jgi:hypothetical protein
MNYRPLPYNCSLCHEPLGRDYGQKDFMVHDSVWVHEAKLPKFGCFAHKECLEKRLGRKLVRADFKDAKVNRDNGYV